MAKPGDYGYSGSYGDVLMLRAEVERLREALTRIESISETFSDGRSSAEECLKEIACVAYVALGGAK